MAAQEGKAPHPRLGFADFILDLEQRGLFRGEERLPLNGKPLETLIYLVQNHGQLVTREVLLEAIWYGVHVTPNTVEHAVAEIRHALADGKGKAQFIQTVSGKGYCFISCVTELDGASNATNRKVQSIAVLPFGAIGRDAEDSSLGLGIADALITRLSNCRSFNVYPAASTLRYVGQNTDPVEAGRELGADLLLEGMIQRLGNRIRLSVQLIRATNGELLWGDTLDGDFTDLFSLEPSLSKKICRRLSSLPGWLSAWQPRQAAGSNE